MRASGVLLPISSLPSKYGIGSFSKSAYDFVDKLRMAGQTFWQILPIGPTGYGDSPYQSFSTFAGNPYFIDLEQLIEEGLLTKEECDELDFGSNPRYIDYEKIYLSRFPLLWKAYLRSKCRFQDEFIRFTKANAFWLNDYALYMAIKDLFKGASWDKWEDDIKFRKPMALQEYERRLDREIEYYKYIQFLFFNQWSNLKKYANDNGILIMGDIPIYVALDSADAWFHPDLFQFDENLKPIALAGCPPDSFSDDGQFWGNPLYRWEGHKESKYEWWISRIAYSFKLYDYLRIDHFKGFDEYYSIPYTSKNARNGEWKRGPGFDFFKELESSLGKLNIIAEDLGHITNSVIDLLKMTGYPGMKVLEFAFDSKTEDSDYLPHNYDKNCVVYTGTHDNRPIKDWIRRIPKEDIDYILNYTDKDENDLEDINWIMIRLAMASVANICIIPMQDYLGLGEEARINEPSTVGDNWIWRLLDGDVTKDLISKIKYMTKLYGRI